MRKTDRALGVWVTACLFLGAMWMLLGLAVMHFMLDMPPDRANAPSADVAGVMRLASMVMGVLSVVFLGGGLVLGWLRAPDAGPRHVWWYTVLLGLLGLLLMAPVVLFHTVMRDGGPSREPHLLWLLTGLGAVPFLGIVAAISARVARSRYAEPATAAISLLLVFSFPLGTGLAALWFLLVRGKEAQPEVTEGDPVELLD